MYVSNVDCMTSFEKGGFSIDTGLLAIKKMSIKLKDTHSFRYITCLNKIIEGEKKITLLVLVYAYQVPM